MIYSRLFIALAEHSVEFQRKMEIFFYSTFNCKLVSLLKFETWHQHLVTHCRSINVWKNCTWLVYIWCKYSYLNDLFCISVILNGKVGKNMTHHNHNLTLITRKHYNKGNCVVGLFCTVGKNVPTHHPCENYSVWHFIGP